MAHFGMGGDGAEVKEPDTYMAFGIRWDEALNHAYQVIGQIGAWNAIKGQDRENHYARLEIQAFTIIKTLPTIEPWETFRMIYWRIIGLYIATISLQDSDLALEDIDKRLIRWNGTVDEVLVEMQRLIKVRQRRVVLRGDPYWKNMYDRLEGIEQKRVAKQRRREYLNQFALRKEGSEVIAGSSMGSTSTRTISADLEENCRTCGPDYVPETPPISSDDSGYYYDPLDLN